MRLRTTMLEQLTPGMTRPPSWGDGQLPLRHPAGAWPGCQPGQVHKDQSDKGLMDKVAEPRAASKPTLARARPFRGGAISGMMFSTPARAAHGRV